MSPQDAALVRRWNESRDPDAFSEIVRRYTGVVYSPCLRILRNRSDAEDVTQECFMSLSEVPLKATSSLASWLHTIATRRALNRLRSERRRQSREEAYAKSNSDADEHTWDDVQQFVDEAMLQISNESQYVIAEHFLMGRSYASISEELGISRQAVSQRAGRGIESIRTQLRKKGLAVSASVLSVGISDSVSAAPAVTLTQGLIRLGLSGVDGRSAYGGAAVSIGSGFRRLAVLAVALVSVGVTALLVRSSSLSDTDRSQPGEAGLEQVGSTAVASSDRSSDNVIRVAQAGSGDVSSAGNTVVQASDFTTAMIDRPLPEPGTGTVYFYITTPDAEGATIRMTLVDWLPWETPPTQKYEVSSVVGTPPLVSFRNLPLGTYNWIVSKGDSGLINQIEVSESMTGMHYAIPMVPQSSMILRIVDENGDPIEGSTVSVYQHSLQLKTHPLEFFITGVITRSSGENGYVERMQFQRGAVKMYARAEGYAPQVSDWIRNREDENVIVLGHGGSYETRVVDSTGEPVEGVMVHLRGPHYIDTAHGASDADGQVRIDNLRPATYSVNIQSRDFGLGVVPKQVSVHQSETSRGDDLEVVAGLEITGTITDAKTERGIAGIPIAIEAPHGGRMENVVTDGNGVYRIPNVGVGTHRLRRVSTPDYGYGAGPRELRVDVDQSTVTGDTDIVLARGIQVTGRVIDSDGNPIAGAMMRTYDENGTSNVDARSDRYGRFRLNSISTPGLHVIRAQAGGFGRVSAEPIEITGNGRSDIEFVMPRAGLVTGTIRINGRNASPGTYLWSLPYAPETDEAKRGTGTTYTYTGDGRGNYILPWLSPGEYNLSVEPKGGSRSPSVATIRVSEGQLIEDFDIDFYPSGLTISGLVTNRNGDPLSVAKVTVVTPTGPNIITETNTTGEFTALGLMDEPHDLIVNHHDYGRSRLYGIQPNNQGLTITLPDHAVVECRAYNADTGEPLDTLRYAQGSGDGFPSLLDIGTFRTVLANDGVFTVDQLNTDAMEFTFYSEGFAPVDYEFSHLNEGPNSAQVELYLNPAVDFSGTIVNSMGHPIENVLLGITSGTGTGFSVDDALAQTNEGGEFRISVLPPWQWRLTAIHPDYIDTDFVVNLDSAELHGFELTMESGCEIEGFVFSEDNRPVPGTKLVLRGGGSTMVATTDTNGYYRFNAIPPGLYQIGYETMDSNTGAISVEFYDVALSQGTTQYLNWMY